MAKRKSKGSASIYCDPPEYAATDIPNRLHQATIDVLVELRTLMRLQSMFIKMIGYQNAHEPWFARELIEVFRQFEFCNRHLSRDLELYYAAAFLEMCRASQSFRGPHDFWHYCPDNLIAPSNHFAVHGWCRGVILELKSRVNAGGEILRRPYEEINHSELAGAFLAASDAGLKDWANKELADFPEDTYTTIHLEGVQAILMWDKVKLVATDRRVDEPPAQFKSQPVTLAEMARAVGLCSNTESDVAARKLMERHLQSYWTQKLSKGKYIFDTRRISGQKK